MYICCGVEILTGAQLKSTPSLKILMISPGSGTGYPYDGVSVKIIDYLCDPLQKCLRDENPLCSKRRQH